MNGIKEVLHGLCKQYTEALIQEIEAAITDRREAIANETKSSMGDKYETTREMLQQDINMNLERLSKVQADASTLKAINPQASSATIIPGSLVYTGNGNFYISVSAGHYTIEGKKYYTVSPSSPIGMQLKGKSTRDSFSLNGKNYTIDAVL